MKKKILYVLLMTMVCGTALSACGKKKDVEDTVVVSSSVEEETPDEQEVEAPAEDSQDQPETGNFQELTVEDNLDLGIEEGEVGAGA